ncbi:MAG: cell division protein FtsW [Clostridiales bacterium]|nr:cell division protein FtsW [Clostridiales bacterium]
MAKKRKDRLFQFSLKGLDTNLLVILFFVMVFGFIMIYSASYYTAGLSKAFNYDSMYLLKNQIIYSCLGIAAMIVVSCINYHFWSHFAVLGYIACGVLVVLLKSPLGVTVKGATRWLRIGPIQFQVAEPIKLIMIVFMATLIVAKGRHLKSWASMIRMAFPSGFMAVLLLVLSDNMSTAAILLGTAVFMIYVVHPEQWKFILCAAAVAALIGGILYYVESMDPLEVSEANFRLARIRAWLNPYEYEQDKAFQSLQGLYAIGSGGLWGKGLGNSIQKLGKIPEPYNDYIFAIICEELGIFGAGLIIFLFIYLLYRIYTISQTAEDLLGRMLSIGVFSHIALQVILNLMVVTGLFPTTGVTLPFFSYGGTATVFLLIEIGLVLSVNKYSVKKRMDAIREAGLE